MSRLYPPHFARHRGPAVGLVLLATVLAGCGVAVEDAPAGESAEPAAAQPKKTEPTSGSDTEPVQQVPPVPMIQVPDLSVLDGAQAGLASTLDDAVADLADTSQASAAGVTVAPARCDAGGNLVHGDAAVLYGDGAGSFVGADGNEETWNYGSGAGSASDGDGETWNYGTGAGSYTSDGLEVWNYGDGSGSYTSDGLEVWNYGDGTGSYTSDSEEIWNYGDGSGSYTSDSEEIWNYGDGSGSYVTGTAEIRNNGDGTGTVDGVTVKMEPLPKLPPLGEFPPLEALKPLAPSCGTLITLPGGVLFDFDSDALRPEADAVMDALSEALNGSLAVGGAVQVMGHTDSISDDQYNLDLSERRAETVRSALVSRSVESPIEAIGLGESQPVAANEIGGVDNPAGRQLNRRVEILIPPR